MKRRLYREWEMLRMVWSAARGQHFKMAVALLLELLIGLFPPAAVYILQRAAGINAGNLEAMFTRSNILWALVIYFIYILMTKVTRVMTAYAVAEVEYGMRMRFSEALKRMPYEEVCNHIGMATSNGLTQEIAMASSLIPTVYKSFIRGGVTIVAFCVLLVVIDPMFFLIVLGLTAAVMTSIVLLRKRLKRIHKDLYNRISSLYQYFAEWMNGYRVFKVYGCMDFAVSRMQRVFKSIRDISRRLTVVSNSQSAFAEMLTYGLAALIIVMMPHTGGIVDISVLVSYPAAILFIRGELMEFINGYQQLATTDSSVTRLFDVIRESDRPETQLRNLDNVDNITFDRICYSYGDDDRRNEILESVDLEFKAGELYVLTGPSGTGKTTTLNLMLGLLRQQSGEIEVHRRNADAGDGGGVALVEQEPFMFDGSLYDNICMGRKGITDDEIMTYLKRLGMERLFPDRESLHQDRARYGVRLSSGEKQRIALIRALVTHPSVLVVDEVTSNIDGETSRLIIDYIKDLSRHILVVAVSHDPMFIAASDRILLLENKNYKYV